MTIKVVWRELRTKNFHGPEAKELAKAFCKRLKASDLADAIEAVEIKHGGVIAYFDTDDSRFARHEMDG